MKRRNLHDDEDEIEEEISEGEGPGDSFNLGLSSGGYVGACDVRLLKGGAESVIGEGGSAMGDGELLGSSP